MIARKYRYRYVIAGLVLALAIILPEFSLKAANTNSNIACFVYHRFGDGRYPSTNISVEAFREHLSYLKQNNFRVWTMGKAVKAILNGDIVPPKTVVLTIDDSYHSFYENGLPLLEEFGYPATLFVNTENVGNKDYLSWQEILDAQRRGIEIGNHSHGHGHFLDIPSEEDRKNIFISDLVTAQSLFNEHLGYSPELYSYPYGEYDAMMQNVLEEAGYLAATAQYSGVLYKGSNLFEIPRFPMGGPYATVKGFIQKSQMLAMQLSSIEPAGIVLQQNPPILEIIIQSYCIDVEKVQCFVNGQRNCIVELHESPGMIRMKIKSKDRLSGRRALYTLTAPSKDGKGWCWYSHVWVNTSVKED